MLRNRIYSGKQRLYFEAEWSCFGEIWSARLLSSMLSEYFDKVAMVDARKIIYVKNTNPDVHESKLNLSRYLSCNVGMVSVMTGYIASDEKGRATTLGRNVSDYSASLIASLLSARTLHFWTDVDAVYSADPRIVKDALLLPELNHTQMHLLAPSGNTILHSRTILPLRGGNCMIDIRNSHRPHVMGTIVSVASKPNITFLWKTLGVGYFPEEFVGLLETEHIAFRLPKYQGGGCIVDAEVLCHYEKFEGVFSVVNILIYYGTCNRIGYFLKQFNLNFSEYSMGTTLPFTLVLLEGPIGDEHYVALHRLVCVKEVNKSMPNKLAISPELIA